MLSAATLGNFALLAGVDPAVLAAAAQTGHIRDFRDGETIFLRGDPGDRVFIVASGLVRISTLGENGKRITVEIFKPQEMFGEIAVIDGAPRTADAGAVGRTRLAVLPAAAMNDLLTRSPAFSATMLRLLATRLRRTYSLLEDASLSNLEHRLAKQVLYLMGLGASGEGRVKIYSRLRQADLADLLGATPRSIITILNKWRAEALVAFDGRTAQITILDLPRFRQLTGSLRSEASAPGVAMTEPA